MYGIVLIFCYLYSFFLFCSFPILQKLAPQIIHVRTSLMVVKFLFRYLLLWSGSSFLISQSCLGNTQSQNANFEVQFALKFPNNQHIQILPLLLSLKRAAMTPSTPLLVIMQSLLILAPSNRLTFHIYPIMHSD